ncbi:hypothetical protein ACIQYL_14920 [Lysinibacillus xylanilyticus]|uniref:hypothetical protein n=1 Tax=Lysinibacillus xylanilyticus TaxID=582475 RepID=UPI0037FA7DBE
MESNNLVYKAYGEDSFAQGDLDGSLANVKPIKFEMLHFSCSPLILTICTKCGEVTLMKVKKV